MPYKYVQKLATAAALAAAFAGLQSKVHAQVEIPATSAVPLANADSTKKGFIWNAWKLDASKVPAADYSAFTGNSTAATEKAIAGSYLYNEADPNATGVASGPGTWLGTPNQSLLQFIIPTTINLDKAAGSNGHFTPEDQMPGVPGTSGVGNGTDGFAAEILYWVAIPSASTVTFGVNSDDGFRTKVGGVAPRDPLGSKVVGEFNGGRGAADTTYAVKFDAPGLYAFRTTYENGGGGENVSMFTQKADGTFVLLNDTANGGLAVYYSIKGGSPSYVQAASPGPGDQIGYNSPLAFQIADGSTLTVDKTSVVLKLDGTAVTPTVSQASGVTSVSFTPTPPLGLASTHTLELSYKDSAGTVSDKSYSFSVAGKVVPASVAVAAGAVDTTKPGFLVKPYQVTSGQPNTMAWTEEMFAGLHGPNISDLTQTVSGKPIDANGYYTYTGVVNWDKDGSNDGNFQDAGGYTDTVMPGQPSADGNSTYANDGEEVLTYVQFPAAGVYTMGVNSDDGFKVTTGTNPKDAFQSITLGIFDGGRGASDTLFQFQIQQAGIYPMRLLWENGGSGANCEWFTVSSNGVKTLLNDPSATNTTGIKAYYSGPAGGVSAYVLSFSPHLVGGTLVLADAGTKVKAGSTKLLINGTAVTTTESQTNGVTKVTYTLPAPLPSGSTNSLSVSFTDNTSATVTNGTSFVAGTFTGTTKDTIKGYVGYIRGGAGGLTADAGGRTGKPGDKALDSTAAGGTWVDIEDMSFFNAAAAKDILSVSLWVKKYDIAAGSAFWAQLSQVATGTDLRGYQSHIPWSDDTIYFDTAGCCDTAVQRISANINTFADYTTVGTDAYWTNWHHFVYTKNGPNKNIYIDGKLFLNGTSTDPLTPNFVGLALLTDGLPGGDYMHGLIDDFAVYSTEVSAADAAKLASGTSPKDLTGETLVAFWNFDDASGGTTGGGTNSFSNFTVSSDHKSVVLTYTGTLQSGDAVTGPWIDVAGAASPATEPIATSGQKFYRVH